MGRGGPPISQPSPSRSAGCAPLRAIRDVLGFADDAGVPTERNWERDGLVGEEVSWSAGFGPRTSAWVLKPARASGPLPAVLALHGHDSFKYYGKEKVADGPDEAAPGIQHLREEHHEALPANSLAGRASWSSRTTCSSGEAAGSRRKRCPSP